MADNPEAWTPLPPEEHFPPAETVSQPHTSKYDYSKFPANVPYISRADVLGAYQQGVADERAKLQGEIEGLKAEVATLTGVALEAMVEIQQDMIDNGQTVSNGVQHG
jgi:hypothetical protein